MYIESGQFRQYRNYADVILDHLARKNLLLGPNAAGKTNILEAIYFLSHGKSPRTRQDRELIQWGQPFATLSLTTRSNATEDTQTVEAQLIVSPEGTLKTVFKVNGHPVRSRSAVVGKIPTVTFFLSDLLMLRGTPSDRRNALDSSLVQYRPIHFQHLATYNKIRQQKSHWLKQPPHFQDLAVLESLNHQLAQAGAQVIASRMEYLQALETEASVKYFELSQGQEPLRLGYETTDGIESSPILQTTIETTLFNAMEAQRQEEIRRAQVLVGPHRDDIQFFLGEHDACSFGSQGQQRSIVLAFKLAEIQLLTQQLQGETPILLLDDVMAELDPTRQHQLLAHLNQDMQVFLTTTHIDDALQTYLTQADIAPGVQFYKVEKGQLMAETQAEAIGV